MLVACRRFIYTAIPGIACICIAPRRKNGVANTGCTQIFLVGTLRLGPCVVKHFADAKIKCSIRCLAPTHKAHKSLWSDLCPADNENTSHLRAKSETDFGRLVGRSQENTSSADAALDMVVPQLVAAMCRQITETCPCIH